MNFSSFERKVIGGINPLLLLPLRILLILGNTIKVAGIIRKPCRHFGFRSLGDTIQPCDRTQARPDLDFGVKVSIIQFHAI